MRRSTQPKSRGRALARAALLALFWPGLAGAADLTMLAHPPSVASPHPPLIVLLHGADADENDMIGLWTQLPPRFAVVSPRGPFGGGGRGWRWYRKGATRDRDIAASRKVVDLVVEAAIKRFDADKGQVFLGGFSQGGVMTYEVALHEPGRFRGAVVLSGALFPSALAGDLPGPNATPFFVAHGTADPRIAFATAQAARTTLAARELGVTFEPVDGMSHAVGDTEMAAVSAWLHRQLRGTPP